MQRLKHRGLASVFYFSDVFLKKHRGKTSVLVQNGICVRIFPWKFFF